MPTKTRLTVAQLQEQLRAERANSADLEESLAELELGFEDIDWIRDGAMAERDFSRYGLQRLIYRCRLAFLKDPLIRNGVNIQAHYVFGQGVEIRAKDPQVNRVVQAFLDDRRNAKVLTGHAARKARERQLQIEGNMFLALFTDASNGFVRIRLLPVDQIKDVMTNPDDSEEVWYYRRRWSRRTSMASLSGIDAQDQGDGEALYPDWLYQPENRPDKIGDLEVRWDSPVYHVAVGNLGGMSFGVPEIYPALDWAQAVKKDLENYATVKQALARFVWNMKVGGGKGAVARARERLASTLGDGGDAVADRNPPPIPGSTFIGSGGASMEPIRTAGATTSPNDARYLWLQVGAALGIPYTMLAGDPEAGNLATAKTLDRPTELKMADRQELWADIYRDILDYVIDSAALAVDNPLDGNLEPDEVTGEDRVVLTPTPDAELMPAGDGSAEAEVTRDLVIRFPNILERDTKEHIQAIVQATTLGGTQGIAAGTIPPKVVTGALLSALGVDDVDTILEVMFPDDSGNGDPAADAVPGAGGVPVDQSVIETLREAVMELAEAVGAAA